MLTGCFARFGSNGNNGLLVGCALNLNNALSNSNWNYGLGLTYQIDGIITKYPIILHRRRLKQR